jgi:homeodomain-containing protein
MRSGKGYVGCAPDGCDALPIPVRPARLWIALHRLWPRWSEVLVFVKPETVLRWHRAAFRRYGTWLSRHRRRPGRPATDQGIRDLIRRMAAENPTWGAPRIHGELRKLGVEVSERTVSRYLPHRPPRPDAIHRWLAPTSPQFAQRATNANGGPARGRSPVVVGSDGWNRHQFRNAPLGEPHAIPGTWLSLTALTSPHQPAPVFGRRTVPS